MSSKDWKPSEGSIYTMTPYGGPISRGRGCWSCISFDWDQKARSHWKDCANRDLSYALSLAIEDPRGESHPKVMQIRRMISNMDKLVGSGTVGICMKGKAGADFVYNSYLCEHWNGRDGYSLAAGSGKIDDLPEELKDKLESKLPTTTKVEKP